MYLWKKHLSQGITIETELSWIQQQEGEFSFKMLRGAFFSVNGSQTDFPCTTFHLDALSILSSKNRRATTEFSSGGISCGQCLLNFESARWKISFSSGSSRSSSRYYRMGGEKGRKIYYALSSAGETCVPSLYSSRLTCHKAWPELHELKNSIARKRELQWWWLWYICIFLIHYSICEIYGIWD